MSLDDLEPWVSYVLSPPPAPYVGWIAGLSGVQEAVEHAVRAAYFAGALDGVKLGVVLSVVAFFAGRFLFSRRGK